MKLWNMIKVPVGFLLLAIGAIGVFLPIWPTTPFVLLAAACFSSHPKLVSLLHKNKFFHEHIINYKERTGLRQSNLIISLTFLWITLIISMILSDKAWMLLLLCGVGIAVTIHLLYMAHPKRKRNI